MTGMIHRPLDRSAPNASGLPRPLRIVLLAVGGLPGDRAVVDRAIAIAGSEDAQLVALHVLPADQGTQAISGDGPVPPELDRIVLRASAAGVRARHLVRTGEAGTEILRAARTMNADIVVMGTGTACGHVLNHGDCPTLVVRPWAEAGPGWDEPLSRVRSGSPSAGEPAVSRPAWPAIVEDAQRTVPIVDDRVACRLLGDVALQRCRECDHLVRLEFSASGLSAPSHVICRDAGSALESDLSW